MDYDDLHQKVLRMEEKIDRVSSHVAKVDSDQKGHTDVCAVRYQHFIDSIESLGEVIKALGGRVDKLYNILWAGLITAIFGSLGVIGSLIVYIWLNHGP